MERGHEACKRGGREETTNRRLEEKKTEYNIIRLENRKSLMQSDDCEAARCFGESSVSVCSVCQ